MWGAGTSGGAGGSGVGARSTGTEGCAVVGGTSCGDRVSKGRGQAAYSPRLLAFLNATALPAAARWGRDNLRQPSNN